MQPNLSEPVSFVTSLSIEQIEARLRKADNRKQLGWTGTNYRTVIDCNSYRGGLKFEIKRSPVGIPLLPSKQRLTAQVKPIAPDQTRVEYLYVQNDWLYLIVGMWTVAGLVLTGIAVTAQSSAATIITFFATGILINIYIEWFLKNRWADKHYSEISQLLDSIFSEASVAETQKLN